jgi:hypothetical protein
MEAVMEYCSVYSRFEHNKSKGKKYFFILKPYDDKLIGKSDMNETNVGLNN